MALWHSSQPATLASPCPAGERLDEMESEEDEREVRAREKRTAFEALQHARTQLPMYEFKEPLLKAIAEYQTLVIVGETGSGKTTQVRCAHDCILCMLLTLHFVHVTMHCCLI